MKARKKEGGRSEGPVLELLITTTMVHLLALCVIILYKILQQIHALFGLDFINFDEILWKGNRIGCWSLQTGFFSHGFGWQTPDRESAPVTGPRRSSDRGA